MPKQALLNGTLEDANDFDGYNELELLKQALENNSWLISESRTERAGYNYIKIVNGDKELTLHVYLKKVNWRHRSDYEKAMQFPADHITIGYEVEQSETEKTVMLGIYKRDTFDDYLICAWQPSEWGNRGKAFNCFIDVHALAEAYRSGFTNDHSKLPRKVFAFRPEFIHYYLLNKDRLHGIGGGGEEAEIIQANPLSNQPLNQILYGPPGTGKTHNAINHALSIVKGNDLAGMTRMQIKDEFDALISEGQIQFVTFHQSYSYEEFVEGIKPSVNGSNVEYNIEDGIFKKLCLKAQNTRLLETGEQFSNSRGGIFTISKINNEIIEITRDEGSIITLPKALVFGLLKLLNENTITIENIQSREKDGTPLQDLLDIKYDKYIFGYDSILKALLEYILSKKISTTPNYVLIIDEINRGNISKIFGELITLIEDSKRIGAKEELKTKLTYSGAAGDEMFGVPNNVYIVGTMNSADRSIALIDTALRRRFTFFEYTADSTLLSEDVEGINLQDLVQMMNSRIEFLLDKDHLLGHAYFINVATKNDLCSAFRNKVIPLLEEYFYGDYEKIQLVLGDNKEFGKTPDNRIVIPKSITEQRKMFGKEVDGFEEKILYTINEKIVTEDYSSITAEFFTSIYTKTIAEA
jgi:AAA domain (dynein-related subfamily)